MKKLSKYDVFMIILFSLDGLFALAMWIIGSEAFWINLLVAAICGIVVVPVTAYFLTNIVSRIVEYFKNRKNELGGK